MTATAKSLVVREEGSQCFSFSCQEWTWKTRLTRTAWERKCFAFRREASATVEHSFLAQEHLLCRSLEPAFCICSSSSCTNELAWWTPSPEPSCAAFRTLELWIRTELGKLISLGTEMSASCRTQTTSSNTPLGRRKRLLLTLFFPSLFLTAQSQSYAKKNWKKNSCARNSGSPFNSSGNHTPKDSADGPEGPHYHTRRRINDALASAKRRENGETLQAPSRFGLDRSERPLKKPKARPQCSDRSRSMQECTHESARAKLIVTNRWHHFDALRALAPSPAGAGRKKKWPFSPYKFVSLFEKLAQKRLTAPSWNLAHWTIIPLSPKVI